MQAAVSYSNERYLLHLFARALSGGAPRELPSDCSWQTVFDLSCQNGVQGLIWEAARHLASVPDELRSVWERASSAILIRNVQLDADREEIVKRLTDAGISYLVLKGAALLPLYPNPSMRTMSDNDILYGYLEIDPDGGYRIRGCSDGQQEASRSEAGDVVRSVMSSLGYTVLEHGGDVCDVQFSKAPYYRYEMHFALMEKRRPYYFYFANPWKRAIPQGEASPDRGREFKFSQEDQYVYMIVHAYKHENMGGEGIRILGDIAVTLHAAGDNFDFNYVENELSRMGLADYERSLRHLTEDIIFERDLDVHNEELAMQMIACGQGSVERFVSSKIQEERASGNWGRLGYLRKLCSPEYYCPGELDFLVRHRFLRPLFPIGRLILFLHNGLKTPKAQLLKARAFLRGK